MGYTKSGRSKRGLMGKKHSELVDQVNEIKVDVAVIKTDLEYMKEAQKETAEKIENVSVKIDGLVRNGVNSKINEKLVEYKVGLWGWFVRIVMITSAGFVITYVLKKLLEP